MKKLLLFTLMSMLVLAIGCSDDDPVGPTPLVVTEGSIWGSANGYWSTVIDASGEDEYKEYAFIGWDTATSTDTSTVAPAWDVAFKRKNIKINGLDDVEAAKLDAVTFANATIADTAGLTWEGASVVPFIDNWNTYTGPPNHEVLPNRNVYSMVDASGEHYVKFQIDSLEDGGVMGQTDMGTVHITYFYQTTASSTDLSGAVTSTSFVVGTNKVYFDFSTGSAVTPTTPTNSTEWDLAFYAYDIMQNSAPNGIGACEAFQAYTVLTDDPTDIDAFTTQPDAPMFEDIPGSALTEWYDYDDETHILTSKEYVYLVSTGDAVYKLQIQTYYANIGGSPTSAWYTIRWAEL